MTIWLACCLAAAALAQEPPPEEGVVASFGTTVVLPSGLEGKIYFIHQGTHKLPKFEKLKPVGKIYTTSLNVMPREFTTGFPGITDRVEWFAIDYSGRFYVANPGKYEFELASDDGSKLYIDDRVIIDNDGVHPPLRMKGSADLAGGIHRIRVSYFQGPRFHLALILAVARTGEPLRPFNTDEFKPPAHPEDWKYGSPSDLEGAPATAKRKR